MQEQPLHAHQPHDLPRDPHHGRPDPDAVHAGQASAVPALEARITTKRAGRYLTQFCKHAAAMGGGGHRPRMHLHRAPAQREVNVTAAWSDTAGTVTFTPWGRCTLHADEDTLILRIDAATDDGLRQIKDVITRDLERFSRRNPLTVTWQQPASPDATPTPSRDAGD